jgi:hypothetical protein
MPGADDQNFQPGAEELKDKPIEGNQGEGSGNSNPNPKDGGEDDSIFSDPAKAKELAKSLRAESAKYRTKSKDLESKLSSMEATLGKLKQALNLGDDEEESPEEKVKQLSEQAIVLQTELAIRDLAAEHEIPNQQIKYFKFLMAEKFNALGDGEELSEEALNEVIAEVRKGGNGKSGINGTGVHSDGKPNPDAGSGLTLDRFMKMSPAEKSLIYQKDPTTYNKLFSEAREKRLI